MIKTEFQTIINEPYIHIPNYEALKGSYSKSCFNRHRQQSKSNKLLIVKLKGE